MGLPHSDEPTCVSPSVRRLKIVLNDSAWSSDQARAKGMRRLAIAQLGTADMLNELEFATKVMLLSVKKTLPKALRAAANLQTEAHKHKLEACAVECENATKETAWAIARAAAQDKVLAEFAEDVVQILVEMEIPGTKFLDLAPL